MKEEGAQERVPRWGSAGRAGLSLIVCPAGRLDHCHLASNAVDLPVQKRQPKLSAI